MKRVEEPNSQNVANELNRILADEYLLYTKPKNAHWNIEGIDFYQQHKFFEDQVSQLDESIDKIAERIRTLGHYVPATMKSFIALAHLSEEGRSINDSTGFITELLSDHESIIIRLGGKINLFAETYQDRGTSDFLTGVLGIHEKMAWILRSHLK